MIIQGEVHIPRPLTVATKRVVTTTTAFTFSAFTGNVAHFSAGVAFLGAGKSATTVVRLPSAVTRLQILMIDTIEKACMSTYDMTFLATLVARLGLGFLSTIPGNVALPTTCIAVLTLSNTGQMS